MPYSDLPDQEITRKQRLGCWLFILAVISVVALIYTVFVFIAILIN